MATIDRSHLDFDLLVLRERDRCQAFGVHEYVFTISETDLNFVAKLVRRLAEALATHELGHIESVDTPAHQVEPLRHVLPGIDIFVGDRQETEAIVAFRIVEDGEAEPQVLLGVEGPLGTITLNRPKALNALSLPMIRVIEPQLAVWAGDPTIRAVVIRGTGDKAFCAGGDVVAISDAGLRERHREVAHSLTVDFFREEYGLNHRIHRFPKPFIALIDGISMGGGFGLSVHGSHRVITERALFAMPETAIGLFPDVGGGWFLSQCPGQLGVYLGLTGYRCRATDCLHVGYATHHVPSGRLDEVMAALLEADWPDAADRRHSDAVVNAVLGRFATAPGPAPLAEQRPAIDRCFSHTTVEDIFTALKAEGDDWAADTLDTLRRMSPTSLKIALRQIRECAGLEYEDTVTVEYRMMQSCLAGHDFYEGVRALLVDKDRNPRWHPPDLGQVSQDMIDRHFAPLGDRDLILAGP